MKVPLSWLKEYVDIDLSVEELAYRLTMAGLEVEAVHYVGLPPPESKLEGRAGGHMRLEYKVSGFEWGREKIVVGAILEVMPHPNADKLVLCKLDDGEQIHTVLTGAPNLFPYKGQGPLDTPLKVCYAREGATIVNAYEPGDSLTTLRRRSIRGVESYSMACSERELGISDEHEGIIILDEAAPVGMPLQDYMGDAVFDIAITPNIARNANVLGIAREVAAMTGAVLRQPDLAVPAEGPPIEGKVSIRITEPEVNPRFVLGLIEGVTIGPSPYPVQLRLRLAGQRPINNIVDATNYAMLELGEPLHAFDYDFLARRVGQAGADAPTILTRRAQAGEKLTTLDGEERTLDDFTVLVCDQSGPLALAGVMGGLESEVTEGTVNVLLEGASWNMINTRRTQMSQKLASEAGYRFSRGVHPAMAPRGVLRGLALMQRWAGGTVFQGLVDEYPLPVKDPVVVIRPQDVHRWLGIDLPAEQITGILTDLGFACSPEESPEGAIRAVTPDHRLDIGTGVVGVADLVEEIARIYGYDNIPETRMADELPPQLGNLALDLEERVRDLLVRLGLQEVITYRMTTPEMEARRLAPGTPPVDRPHLRLANPINQERVVMRQSLMASVLEIVERNARLQERVALFEIGEVFLASEGGSLPDEHSRLVIALAGQRAHQGWQEDGNGHLDFYDLKGVVETLLSALHVDARYETGGHPSFHPGKCANVLLGERRLGTFGELHPRAAAQYDLSGALDERAPVLAGTFSMEVLREAVPDRYESEPVPVYPPVFEDLALVVADDVPADRVSFLIRQTGGALVSQVRLFDVYHGDQLDPGQKSLAYRITYQAPDRTLSDGEVARLRNKIVGRLERELGAQLRR